MSKLAQMLIPQFWGYLGKQYMPLDLPVFTLIMNNVLLGLNDHLSGFPVEVFSYGEIYYLIFHLSSFDGYRSVQEG